MVKARANFSAEKFEANSTLPLSSPAKQGGRTDLIKIHRNIAPLRSVNTIYVYNRDKSVLYYYTNNRQKFLQDLKIHYVTFEKHLAKGTYYLRRYLFTQSFESSADYKALTLPEFVLRLEKDRIKNSKSKR
jgi:hypothetical protein